MQCKDLLIVEVDVWAPDKYLPLPTIQLNYAIFYCRKSSPKGKIPMWFDFFF